MVVGRHQTAMQDMKSTGEAATLLGVTETRLNDLVRRGKINPAPRLFAGRRAWEEVHVRQAARALGINPDARLWLEQPPRASEERES